MRREEHARQSFFKNTNVHFSKCGRGEKILCRASWRKRTAKRYFAMRFGSGARQSFFKKTIFHFSEVWERDKTLPCVVEKTHGKEALCRAFYFGHTTKSLFAVRFLLCRAPYKKSTTKSFFAVRPIQNARQRF
jgi:hypothetical protein